MQKEKNQLLNEVANYYSDKLTKYGNTPRGVDWNGKESQNQRFKQLCKIISGHGGNFSLNDFGCGYGALLDYLHEEYPVFSYCGIDVAEAMVRTAQSCHVGHSDARFINAAEPDGIADYGVASGIFNVRLGRTDDEWQHYIIETLDIIDRTSRKGVAFNCLTSYSDENKKRDYLYYADPCQLFDLCKRRYSRQVALLHDYELYEFTILVRKVG